MPNLSRQVFWTVCERRWLKQSESAIRACEQFEFRSSDHLRGPETPCPGIPSCMLLNTWILKRIISASSFCPLLRFSVRYDPRIGVCPLSYLLCPEHILLFC